MKPDPLRIEMRKIGGGFVDGPGVSDVVETWAILMAHADAEPPQEFVLAVGTLEQVKQETIKRLQNIILKLM